MTIPVRSSAIGILLALSGGCARSPAPGAGPATASLPVVPLPAQVSMGRGTWTPPGDLPADLALASDTGLARAGIRVQLVPADSTNGLESYRLVVTPRGAEITAPRPAGRFYALVTLQQLTDAATTVPSLTITDAPRFPWRGLHLDVARHFQPVGFVKRYIDLMSRYKLNTFHWHLTDDQGWRIPIAKYPRLTEVGSCRVETMVEKRFDPYVGDGMPHCGSYTREEIREVIAYAAARHVTVVPEIEMPGHAVAALTAYPEFACTAGPFKVRTTWGVDDNVFCPSERTFAFLQDVLTEVMALFPSRYIHIGGDEAPKVRWKASPLAQEIIRREGLKDEHELQSWFIRRIDAFLTRNGRRLVGWDEILEGGLAPGATVMSWRGTAGGIDAARLGRDVVMTPNSHLYLDHYQGDARFEPLAIGGLSTLERVYSYEPIPDELTADQAARILGAQGNVWTEYLKTPEAVEYMAYPRAIALAEVTWSPRARRDWQSFSARLPFALRALDRHLVNYRLPHVSGLDADVLTLDATARVTLGVPLAGAAIHYTLDGSDPTGTSPRYGGPLSVPVSATGTRVTARAFTREGRASPPRAATFRRTSYRAAERLDPARLSPGLAYEYFEARIRTTRALDTLRATRSGAVDRVARRGDERPELYGIRLAGFLQVPADAIYEFSLISDDGSTLAIGDQVIVDHDGFHGADERTGMVALRAGLHPLTVRFFQGEGGVALEAKVRRAGGAWTPIPAEWLRRPR
jgi:hexosaminidase